MQTAQLVGMLIFTLGISLHCQRSQFESLLTRSWLLRGLLSWLLAPIAFLFYVLVTARRILYQHGWLKSTRLPVPVIVVGNVFVGGTGKTPLTIWLVTMLQQAGYVPGVISRGYGGRFEEVELVLPGSFPTQVGDEPVLIAQHTQCPVVVGRDRVVAAKKMLSVHPEVNVIVSDDGLQHYAMQRDIEIILFDSRGAGNGWMLPAGPLREPVSRHADFIVINDRHIPSIFSVRDNVWKMELIGCDLQQLCDRTNHIPLRNLLGIEVRNGSSNQIVAAAGIGNPARFFTLLRNAGLTFQEMPLHDHYDFTQNPFVDVQADWILITEKDAVKCARIEVLKNDPRIWIVPVSAQIDGILAKKIVEKLSGCSLA